LKKLEKLSICVFCNFMMILFLCLCAQAVHFVTTLSPYQNDWDEEMRFNSGFMKDKVITGMVSHHSNRHEDRLWRYYYGSARGVYCLRQGWTSYRNSWDGNLDFKCGHNQALSGIWFYHSNYREDRLWRFQCCTMKGFGLRRERLTSDLNSWDGGLNFKCGDNEVLVGLMSHHNNHREDRIWRARCALVDDLKDAGHILNNHRTTGYVNNWDHHLSFSFGNPWVITGLYSVHDNRKEDRRFRIHHSRLKGMNCRDAGWSGFINGWDGIMDYKCKANHAMSGLQSWHDNRREDRRWKVRCCDLSNNRRYMISSYMTGYVNGWDGRMNYKCPSNEVLVGLYSHHDNHKEDRRFKFYCGTVITGYKSPNLHGVSRRSEVQRQSYFFNKKIEDVFIIMTHNSLSLPGKVLWPNQNRGLARQFRDGVRGFNFDLYRNGNKIKTEHGPVLSYNPEDQIKELMEELNKDRYDDSFIFIQLESYIDQSHNKILERWFGSKLVKDFNRHKTLGYYMERNQQVLIFTDKTPNKHRGIHKTTDFIVENNYDWNAVGFPNMGYRRGPKSGMRMRLMNNFITPANMASSSVANGYSEVLRNIDNYRKQSYTGNKINGIIVDYYEIGSLFRIQSRMRR